MYCRCAEIGKVGSEKKPVYTVQLIPGEQLILLISGRQRHVRLLPYLAVEGREVDGVKLTDSKNCTSVCVGLIRQGSSSCLCVAVKRTVYIYELTRTRLRHRCVRARVCAVIIIFYFLKIGSYMHECNAD